VPVIASGGVGTLDHLVEGVTKGHASAVLAASIFHFGTYSIAEAHAALAPRVCQRAADYQRIRRGTISRPSSAQILTASVYQKPV
jgi:hypothetical protein